MPTLDTIIPEVTKQCIEPASEQIVNRLLQILGFTNIFKESIFVTSDDLKSSNFENPDHKKRIPNNRCDVQIIPGYNPLGTSFDIVSGRSIDVHDYSKRWLYDEFPVFRDPRASIALYEITVPCSVELKFSLKVKNVELSDMINTSLFSRYLTGGSVHDYSDLQFSYGLPFKIVELMFHMYNLQPDISKVMSFQEYARIGSKSAITFMVNRERLTGDQALIVQRTNSKVLGKMEYAGEIANAEEIGKVTNRYVTEFSYFFQFSKPSILRMSYPIMVSNQLVGEKYAGKAQSMSYGETLQVFPEISINNFLLGKNNARINLSKSYPLVRYPEYDDWQRSSRMYRDINTKYQMLFIGLLIVNVDETTGTQSLSVDIKNEIFPMLNPVAVTEIERVITSFNLNPHAYLSFGDHFRRLGLFDIAVFCNDAMISFENLTLTDDFILTVGGTIDQTNCYRVVISQNLDIRILNRQYIFYILENPAYYSDFIAANIQYLVANRFINVVRDDLTKTEYAEMQHIGLQSPSNNLPRQSILVNNYVIEVNRNRY